MGSFFVTEKEGKETVHNRKRSDDGISHAYVSCKPRRIMHAPKLAAHLSGHAVNDAPHRPPAWV